MFEDHVKTCLALGALSSSRVEWLIDDWEVEALRSLVSLPWMTQQHFVGMLQARRIDLVDFYFLFEWHQFCLWKQLDSECPFASVPDVQRQRCWKRGTCSGDGQSLWDYCTTRLSDLSMPLTGEVWRSPEPSTRPSAAAVGTSGNFVRRAYSLDCAFAFSHRARCTNTTLLERGSGDGEENDERRFGKQRTFSCIDKGRDLVFMTTARAIFQCRWKVRFDAHLNSLHGSR